MKINHLQFTLIELLVVIAIIATHLQQNKL